MKHIVRLARKYAVPALVAVVVTTAAHAQTAEAVDLSPITTGITAAKTAMIGIAAAIIGAGIAAGAIKWGGRWAVGLFKIFTR